MNKKLNKLIEASSKLFFKPKDTVLKNLEFNLPIYFNKWDEILDLKLDIENKFQFEKIDISILRDDTPGFVLKSDQIFLNGYKTENGYFVIPNKEEHSEEQI